MAIGLADESSSGHESDEYLRRLEAVLQRVISETLTAEEIATLIDLLTKVSFAARTELGTAPTS